VQSFQASMKYYSFDVENGSPPVFSFTARLPEVFPRNGRFGDLNVRRLTYTLEPGPDQLNNLVLRQCPVLMDMDPDEVSTPLVLARNVKEFSVECWDTNQLAWVTEWDDTNSIPPLVRVSFTLGSRSAEGQAGPDVSLTRVIAPGSGTLPATAQAPGAAPGRGSLVAPGGQQIPQVPPPQ